MKTTMEYFLFVFLFGYIIGYIIGILIINYLKK